MQTLNQETVIGQFFVGPIIAVCVHHSVQKKKNKKRLDLAEVSSSEILDRGRCQVDRRCSRRGTLRQC